ncbi:MAG: O-antigen ligase family protein, partial [Bacteroidales bacterium]|nr:O-antigen ligase family protein [Bacteroidales bacterium]
DHTAYGAVLAFFLPLSIGFIFLPDNQRHQRLFYLALSVIFTVGLYCSFSRAAWISFVAAMGIWVLVKLKIKFSWFVLGTLLIGGTFFYFADDILYRMSRNSQDSSGNLSEQLQSITNISTDASNVERLNRWNSAFGMIRERPVMGWGPGTYQFVYAPFQKPAYKTIITTNMGDGGNAHSEYIGPCAETGFVGLATVVTLFVLILYYGLSTAVKSKDRENKLLALYASLSLVTYFIHGALNNFLDTDKLSLPFWSVFALIVFLNLLMKGEELSE